jgi:methyl-accepting chemotaxis protein
MGVAAVLLSVGITTGTVLYLIKADLIRQANDFQDAKLKMLRQLLAAKGPIRWSNGKLVAGNHTINDNFEVVDRLKEIAGGTATIFMGDTRVSTNVMKEDGTRAVNTKLEGVAKEVAVGQGKPYRGEAKILDVPYFTAYDPLLDQDGHQVGVLYVGVKTDDFFRSFQSSRLIAVLIAILMSILLGGVMIYAVGSYDRAMKDVSKLSKVADDISMGQNLEEELRTSRKDELGDLTKALERMRLSMKHALSRLGGE